MRLITYITYLGCRTETLLLVLLCLGAILTRGSTNYHFFLDHVGSYIATEIQDGGPAGDEEHHIREFRFDGHSSWQVACLECPSDSLKDLIIVGREAWEGQDGIWIRTDFDSRKFPAWNTHALITTKFDLGDADSGHISTGPVVNGEATYVIVIDLGDYGDFMSNLDRKELAAYVREEFGRTEMSSRYVIGKETQRLYEFAFTVKGSNLSLTSITTVDYHANVSIDSPR